MRLTPLGLMRPTIPRWFIAVCFLTFSRSPAEAAIRWNYFSSPDLEVVGPVSEDAAVEMARRLALFRQLFLKTLGISRVGWAHHYGSTFSKGIEISNRSCP